MLAHFQDPLVYLLLAAIAIALGAWMIEGRVGWPVDEPELDALPAPVKRYFQMVLRDGQAVIAAVNISHQGRFDMGESKPNWKPFTSNQRVITRRPGFDWNAQVLLMPGLPVFIHDAYVAGRGRLQASVLGLFTMADMSDSLDLRRGELMRFFC